MRICILKATRRILEMQSDATPGTLLKNALASGFASDEVDEIEVDDAGYAEALASDPVEIAAKEKEAAQKANDEAKQAAIDINLPSWSQVETALDSISNLAEAKAVLKKIARVVYWLAKGNGE